MNAEQIQRDLESLHYWDARVLQLESYYFGDEITMIFEDTDSNVKLFFTGCSKFSFITTADDRIKPLKDLAKSQIPYFLQDIEISTIRSEGEELLKCEILMPPLNVEIVCNNISINKV
ncbi:hypothetical protein P8868_11040 [Bacillus inaquosorum]|uniref:hypothetical protein n=1 Tax=Bacillus TaxID=1386 RepID=UPI000B44D9C9|nr:MULTISPECIES: hypothetical protein [Bacillus]ARV44669.1 hypothetical protein BCV50_06390 [Bacillus subtilis]MCY7766827.1 hypothetical protein [Bacillus inaquosorum]MCY7950704.1 hypothetical protein [Bacillus inaquosorum]MCY8146609.1 hypothetical protein [Bacillus inaquosorum]MCY8375250.1 hypothetical protein [Bacillus inaquosorum]